MHSPLCCTPLRTVFRHAFLLLCAGLAVLVCHSATGQSTWQSSDIGSVALSGTSTETSGTLEITGSGADIWERADEFHFRHQPWTGDGELVARVTSLENTHPWAKVGVMVREAISSGSRHALMCVTPGNGTAFQHRSVSDGDSGTSAPSGSATLPVWLKIVRAGNTLTGYTSSNGTTWTQAGTVTLSGLPATVRAGIALTSHNDGVRCAARVDNIALSGTSGGPDTPGAPVITPRSSEAVGSGYLYTYQIAATNSPTSYSATGLPAGLTLNPNTGEIRGVCGGNGGTYTATLRATNAAGTGTATQTFVVNGIGPIEMPYIREVNPPAAGTYRVGDVLMFMVRFGTGYSYPYVTGRPRIALTIGGNTRYATYAWGSGAEYHAYTYTVSSADVPANGISISDTIDLNGGTLQDSWPLWCALNATAINAAGIQLEAASGPPTAAPTLTTPDNATARFGRDFSLQITATNAPTSYGMTFGATPTRPLGLTIDPNTGLITGTPQASGTYTLTLRAINAAGTGSKTLSLRVPHIIASVGTPTAGTYRAGDTLSFRITFSNPAQITGSPVLGVAIGDRYRFAAYAFGSEQTHTFTYTVQPGDVDTDGTLVLAPTIGLSGGTIRDAESGADFNLELPRNTLANGVLVNAPASSAPVITSSTSASATVGAPFSYTITATNSPTSFGTTNLPSGLAVNTSTGVISGTPTTEGSFTLGLSATNSSGTGQASLALTVAGGGAQPWQARDVGAVAVAGSASESGGTVTIRASGADIWDNADEFHFRYQALRGNGELVARITGLTDTHGWAKAGLMFRESLAPGSRHVFACLSSAFGTMMQHRAATDGPSATSSPSGTTAFPTWLRIVRTQNDFACYTSTNGSNWTLISTVSWGDFLTTVYVGLAVTSHNDGTLTTATFDNVRISGAPPAPNGPPEPPTNLLGSVVSATQINLAWTDNSTNETSFEVERSSDNVAFTLLATKGASVTTHQDTTVSPSSSYYYRVRAVNAQGASTYSGVLSASTPGGTPSSTWDFADIGVVGVAGSNSSSGNTITINGSGHDIWDNSDAFRFVYRQLSGDCAVEAQVTSLNPTNAWAKAGVMIRESLSPGARNAFALVTPSLVAAQARTTTGGQTLLNGGPWTSAPYWVRLVRSGGRITAYASPDGTAWSEIAAYDIALPATVYVGFAVTSHDNSQLTTAVFTDPFVQ